MGQYETHVFVCTSGDDCPSKGDVEGFVKHLRAEVVKAGRQRDIRINKAGCFSQCGHGPVMGVYPENVWDPGVKLEELAEVVQSHIFRGASVSPPRSP